MGATPQLGTVQAAEGVLRDLYVDLRRKLRSWSEVTKQTPQARMGYVGQHLVSAVTGYPGGRSGARGRDLILPNGAHAEIKTCSASTNSGAAESVGPECQALSLNVRNAGLVRFFAWMTRSGS